MTVVVPTVAAVPALRTARVKVPVPPTGNVPVCDLSIVRSTAVTLVTSASLSLAGLGSAEGPVPAVETCAVLVT